MKVHRTWIIEELFPDGTTTIYEYRGFKTREKARRRARELNLFLKPISKAIVNEIYYYEN